MNDTEWRSKLEGATLSPAQLSDAELEQEVHERRRQRSGRHSESRDPAHTPLSDRDLVQCYANLELRPGASLAEVEEAYRSLKKQYHPDQHRDDPERHKTAIELTRELTRAYLTLSTLLDTPNEGS